MRRIDAVYIGLGVLVAGGLLYLLLGLFGLSRIDAGLWSQLLLVVGLVVWVGSYVFRVFGRKMTFNTQMRDYKEAVLQKRREEQRSKAQGEPPKPGR
ncbi:DUF3007 family protein [Gloeobacter violaceus]|uniref:Gsr3242 protein n=1 Tax=Gloeobacter violaceus (strain ATCC 29082 / PCC 7421) TaxID=251221 RepID=Q7NGC9_GLOVI|nr:DUF3007 family protein [Gloeobacter violaceus]BAC91183.1 gsr3242 [Gloeobacter violaceus PCC 7421]